VPKAAREVHLRENLAAGSLTLDAATLASLDDLFPPPRHAQPLSVV
jgi:diketogulonate reductase-like aldo/keto reductase